MSVTIEGFTTDALQAQPFSYEGEARTGRTATTLELIGLVRPSEWVTLKGVYDTWQDLRIADQDTTVSQVVGSTVTVSASANGVTWTNRECWFVDPPTAEQVGTLVRVSAKLVDAAEALAVLIKDEVAVDCGRIQADLEKRKAETDCEIAALSGGLADDFAAQDVSLELINTAAEIDAIDAQFSALRDARQLRSLYDKALSEDLITFGTITLGSATILTTQASESRLQNTSFSLTATGTGLISGSTVPVETREVAGILTSGTIDDVLAWYDSAIQASPSSGTFFPTSSPEFATESILVSGVKSTRTTVNISLVKVP